MFIDAMNWIWYLISILSGIANFFLGWAAVLWHQFWRRSERNSLLWKSDIITKLRSCFTSKIYKRLLFDFEICRNKREFFKSLPTWMTFVLSIISKNNVKIQNIWCSKSISKLKKLHNILLNQKLTILNYRLQYAVSKQNLRL